MVSETERRDQLALDRTLLANERTLLAYIRTALALAGAGAGVIGFLDNPLALPVGMLLVLGALMLLPFGTWRYLKVRKDLTR